MSWAGTTGVSSAYLVHDDLAGHLAATVYILASCLIALRVQTKLNPGGVGPHSGLGKSAIRLAVLLDDPIHLLGVTALSGYNKIKKKNLSQMACRARNL